MTRTFKIALLAFLTLSFTQGAFARQFGFEGYSEVAVDFPDGLDNIQIEKDNSGYMMNSTAMPVQFLIKFYKAKRFSDSKKALEDSFKMIRATDVDIESFQWRNQGTNLGTFQAVLGDTVIAGWGLSTKVPENKDYIVMLAWSALEDAEASGSFMLSALDSLCIDRGSFYEPGPVTSFAVPATGKKIGASLDIDGRKFTVQMDQSDRDGNSYLIEREYEVLKLYQNHPEWQGAWQRYYRMIFRDCFSRLKESAFMIYNVLSPTCKDDTDLAQKLLTWTQGFNYERETTESDFPSPCAVLQGEGSDCDSRAMLLSVLLQNMDIDCIMFVSAEYSHAIAGLVSDHPGISITVGKKKYLTGETTAKDQTWGKISQDQADASKWLPVEPPLPMN